MKEEDRKSRKIKEGVVVSNRMQKTVVIKVSTTLQHPKYGKVIKCARKYYAHDETNELQIGDAVMIAETRPYSKMKRWRVVEKIQSVEQSGESK